MTTGPLSAFLHYIVIIYCVSPSGIFFFFRALFSVSFALHTVHTHHSLFALVAATSNLPTPPIPSPVLTHSELSIAALLPRFHSFPLFPFPSPPFLCACSLALCLSFPSLPLFRFLTLWQPLTLCILPLHPPPPPSPLPLPVPLLFLSLLSTPLSLFLYVSHLV